MTPTQAQQQAIEHAHGELLLAASAGSGKTHVLSQRCVRLICDAPQRCSVEELLVVTFTRAAAAEMRERIVRGLWTRLNACGDSGERRRLQRQIALVDLAEIGTIDAWCGRLVRAHYDALGVDPGFTLLNEADAALLRQEVLSELFEWVYEADAPAAVAARAWLARSIWPDDQRMREAVELLNAQREHLLNPQAWFERQRAALQRPLPELQAAAQRSIASALARECSFQRAQLALLNSADERIRAYAEILGRFEPQLSDLADAAPLADAQRGAASVLPLAVQMRGELSKLEKARSGDKGLAAQVRSRWVARLLKLLEPREVERACERVAASSDYLRTILALEQEFDERLRGLKRRRNVYEFADVLRFALDLLGTPQDGGERVETPIAVQLQQRYAHILVDEFQDTSPVQAELVRLASRAQRGAPNRFLVGDIKQSIYGFRRAEPKLFSALQAQLAADARRGRVLRLSDNFRSHAQLLEPLNGLFAALFDPALGGTGYDREEWLQPRRSECPNPTLDSAPRLCVHAIERHGSQRTEAEEDTIPLEEVEREGRLIATLIHEMLSSSTQVPARGDDGAATLRPLRPGDIVILLRSAWRNAALLTATLRQCGIPCVASGRDSPLDSLEVRDVRNILTLIVNRQQDLALAAYLRGPAVGLDEAELLQIRALSPAGPFHRAVPRFARLAAQSPLGQRVVVALQALTRWAEQARQGDLCGLLRQILRETALTHVAAALPGAEYRVGLIEAFMQIVTDFADRSHAGVAELVEYLDALERHSAAATAAPGAAADQVRVMTIHAAKGLEFPIVFLAQTGAALRRPIRAALLCDEACGLGVKLADFESRGELVTPGYAALVQSQRARDVEEELRLLYVAATRARERLIVLGHCNRGAWESLREQYSVGDKPPLLSRLSAASVLEWVMSAAACGALGDVASVVTTHAPASAGDAPRRSAPRLVQAALESPQPAPAGVSTPPQPGDDAWVAAALRSIRTRPPSSTRTEAVVSVSRLKERLGAAAPQSADTADATHARLHDLSAGDRWHGLGRPRFVQAATRGGLELGRAVHRFLEFAEPSCLRGERELRQQIERLRAAQRLSAAEAALLPIAELLWLGGQPLGKLLADSADRLERETPFVVALQREGGEYQLLRGVVDCLAHTPAGLVLVDYKTDDLDFATPAAGERLRLYGEQVRLYVLAIEQILGKPVHKAHLVFLISRRVLDVPRRALGALGRQLELFEAGPQPAVLPIGVSEYI